MSQIDYSRRGQTHPGAIGLYESLSKAPLGYPYPKYIDTNGAEWLVRNEPWYFMHNLYPEYFDTDPVGTQLYLTRETNHDMGGYATHEVRSVQTQICAAEGGDQEELDRIRNLKPGIAVCAFVEVTLVGQSGTRGKLGKVNIPINIDGINIPHTDGVALIEQSHPEVVEAWIAHIPNILTAIE